mmetsp:Transcript_9967/g.34364  ORF Transcript_9967/g.34364 Transcript_9967/m.34364 type:complete len:238 (+) Transcript_9967:236-949(+)|eukprot:CAMPEP_0197502218 /NCGR_PEP_ID=MMETSP1312-20131121/1413_1 /TAXON_ID=464262 /ORGANISM="Genus nov. species nov., Strain RCC2335" /LENGTH=237 /DNA_ID=CAMNT_0043048415 /DNA_START=225 /DNA_END=935 /DNA_ORIENTATION=+
MGFDWSVGVCVEYAQEIEIDVLPTLSRFATRCLMFFDDRGATESRKKVKLPGEVLTWKYKDLITFSDTEDEDYPTGRITFSDTEDEVEAMDADRRKLYREVKDWFGDEDDDYFEMEQSEDLVSKCFQTAVEELLPGHGGDFELRIHDNGGAYGESDHGAKDQLVYIAYNKYKTVTAEGGLDVSRGGVNVPWGHKMTHIGAQQECAEINASFAVIVEKLGLRAIGDPGLKLLTTASGG